MPIDREKAKELMLFYSENYYPVPNGPTADQLLDQFIQKLEELPTLANR